MTISASGYTVQRLIVVTLRYKMYNYAEDKQFARDVVRVRDAMYNNEFDGIKGILVREYSWGEKFYNFQFNGRKVFMGEFTVLSKEDCETKEWHKIVVTPKSIVHVTCGKDCIMIVDGHSEFDISNTLDYDEDLYFLDALTYTGGQIRAKVVSKELDSSVLDEFNRNYRFKIYYRYVPVLIKLLRYKEYGIV